MQFDKFAKLQKITQYQRSNYLLIACIILAAASLLSGGIFFIFYNFISIHWFYFLASQLGGMALVLFLIISYIRRMARGRTSIARYIKDFGEGSFDPIPMIDAGWDFSEIVESVNLANRRLTDKISSIRRNARRLSYLEEELSSRIRPRNMADKQTQNLVCQLKICTSRLQNDVINFSKNGNEDWVDSNY